MIAASAVSMAAIWLELRHLSGAVLRSRRALRIIVILILVVLVLRNPQKLVAGLLFRRTSLLFVLIS